MNENVQFKVVGKPESDFESGSIEIPHNRASYIYQHQQHYTPTNPPTHQPMNHHLPKVQHGLPTQQPNPTQPTRLPIFPIYAQAAKTAEKSENSDGGLVQNLTRFFNRPGLRKSPFGNEDLRGPRRRRRRRPTESWLGRNRNTRFGPDLRKFWLAKPP